MDALINCTQKNSPDPFMQNLKVDLLVEIELDPTVLSDFTSALASAEAGALKRDLDAYLKKKNQAFLSTLKDRVMKDKERTGTWVGSLFCVL
jgi:hypothetical protein